ncbi:ArsR/SmtB family transcription factor [Halomicrobium salinisoli]|uniref:ArsR/SmtB family transcription factor n=1 Tax=Halomicrobium salinisoli TaxID=2878391 RepID=UPI001CF0397C|nr:winged helix-turn-helix domain-containing protein [Halomicrobium salinisoli]
MSGLIDRIQDRTATPDERALVLEMADREADEALDALSSDTARTAFRTLFEEPATPSEIAERVDTSVQNVHYHLSNLEEAGLVEPIDTVYSEKGNEMTVYGPASDPLVFVGDEGRTPAVRQGLAEVVGGVGLLAAASLFVQWGAERLMREARRVPGAAGPASPDAGYVPPEGSLSYLVFEVVEPGVLFFFATLAVVTLLAVATRR